MYRNFFLCALFVLISPLLFGLEETTQECPFLLEEKVVTTKHTLQCHGKEVPYEATAGNLLLRDAKKKPEASLFFVSYTKEGESTSERPITFCFNGGPGSCAVWLHMGAFGPKKVAIGDTDLSSFPIQYRDNPATMLDVTDLVFIDPISTGYSCSAIPDENKRYHGVEEDIKTMARFIRQFVTRYKRWDSPKYLAGESYGTTRAVGVAEQLHDVHHLDLQGVILISSILNFQTILADTGNDLPYLLYLPAYTATAWHHGYLDSDLQEDFLQAIEESKEFALNEYAQALLQGDAISDLKREEVILKLSRYTGLSPTFIRHCQMRVHPERFRKELRRQENTIVGRFDSRIVGVEDEAAGDCCSYDPSFDGIAGLYTAAMNAYLQRELEWESEEEYTILAHVWPWDYGEAKNRYLNLSANLAQLLNKNPSLQIFAASGYYDLATPFMITSYTMDHLLLDPSLRDNIEIAYYPAGHMMYNHPPSMEKLHGDLVRYYGKTNLSSSTPAENSPK